MLPGALSREGWRSILGGHMVKRKEQMKSRSLICISPFYAEWFCFSVSGYGSLHFPEGKRTSCRDQKWSRDWKGCVLLLKCKPYFFRIFTVPGTHSNYSFSILKVSKIASGLESCFCFAYLFSRRHRERISLCLRQFDAYLCHVLCLYLPYYLPVCPFLSPGALSSAHVSLLMSTPPKKTSPRLPIIIGRL